jgi:hypothetical protein
VLAAMLTTTYASAQGGGAAAAEALFNQGREALDKGDYAAACKLFRESDRLDPAPGTKLNLADCEERRGRVATAWELFRATLQELPESDDRHAIAEQRVVALEMRLARLTMRLAPGAPAGTTVKVGDLELGSSSFGIALPLDPGKHRLVVSAPGFAPRSFDVELAEGKAKAITVGPGEKSGSVSAGTPSVPGEPNRGSDGTGNKTLGYVLGGVGVLGLTVGTVTGIILLGKKSTAEDHCDDATQTCQPEGRDANESGRALAPVSTIGFLVGIAGISAGAYFILSSGKTETALHTTVAPGRSQISLVHQW